VAGVCIEAFTELNEIDESFLEMTGFDEGEPTDETLPTITLSDVLITSGAGAGAGIFFKPKPYEKQTYIPAKKERNKNKYNTYTNTLSDFDFAIYYKPDNF